MENDIKEILAIVTELKSELISINRLVKQPEPIYLNHKDGAAYIHLKEDELRQMYDRRLITRYPRKGSGFRYKIKELLILADAIDKGEIQILIDYKH